MSFSNSKRMLRLAAALALLQAAALWLGASSTGYAADTPAPSVRVQGNHLIDSGGNVLQLRGVNVSALEFAPINGQPQPDGWGGQKPNLSAIAAWKANALRVPLNEASYLGYLCYDPPSGTVHKPDPAGDYKQRVKELVTDATARVAEIESGSSDVTLEIPYEEFDRLKGKPGLKGITTPISDIGMIFITDVEPMLDKNVRLALSMSIDKKAIVDQLLHGYGVPLNTLQAPQYSAFDPSIVVPYDPKKAAELMAASGYSKDKPVKFKFQTTRGFKPKDYEMVEAIVGMWRKIGAEAEIEVYEIAKHYELRATHKLAPAAFYNWGNSIGDPSTSTGFSMFGLSPHCAWHGKDTQDMIGPLWGEKDEAKRIAGYKAVDKYIAENGEVIPLLQYLQPILFKDTVKVTPHVSGALLPGLMS